MDKDEVCRYYSSGQPFVHRDGLYNPHLEPLFTSPTTFPHVPVYLVFVHPHELMFLVNLLFYVVLVLFQAHFIVLFFQENSYQNWSLDNIDTFIKHSSLNHMWVQ